MRQNFSRSGSINYKHNCYSLIFMYIHLLNKQHIYKLQHYVIPFLLPSGQRTMHRGILSKKSLGPIRPVSARKPRGPGFSGLVLPSLLWRHITKIAFATRRCFCLQISSNCNSKVAKFKIISS